MQRLRVLNGFSDEEERLAKALRAKVPPEAETRMLEDIEMG